MHRLVVFLLALMWSAHAWAQCPTVLTSCPSPSYNSVTASGVTATGVTATNVTVSGVASGGLIASQVASNSALKALTAGVVPTVYRAGFTTAGDGGAMTYNWSSTACSISGGDNGSQVAPNSGTGCWLASLGAEIDVRVFGAVCNGSTNDSTAFQNALNAASALGGRVVRVPATKHSCILGSGISISTAGYSGTTLKGTAGLYMPGFYDNTESDWTQFGSWLHCEDTVNACVTLSGNGSAIEDLNFWWTQPTPPSGTSCATPCTMTHNWTPTAWPYGILISNPQNFNHVSGVNMVNGTNCIDIEGPTTGVGTIATYIEHSLLGCFTRGTKFHYVDNAIDIHDVNYQIFWYQFSSDLVGWTEGDANHIGNKIDWDIQYLADLHAEGVQFYQSYAAMMGTDATVSSGLGNVTFAMQAGQMANMNFNQVCQALILAANTTHFSARMANIALNVDPQTSYPQNSVNQCGSAFPYAFNVNSNNAHVAINNLDGYYVQSVANIGGGTAGEFSVFGMRTKNYSAFANGANAFNVNTGAVLDIPADMNALVSTATSPGYTFVGTPNWPTLSAGGIQLPQVTVANLPTCNNAYTGMQMGVTDATTPTYGGTLTGGSTTKAIAYCNGTAWVAH